MRRSLAALVLCAVAVWLSACAAKQDYALYRSRMPRSILILPPLNSTTTVEASYIFLSTVSRPLAERGYYVFPVAVIDAYMKENGLPSPDEMNGVSLKKIKEVFGADAVLYFTIEDWGQKYYVISSNTVVRASARLVDVESGETLWTGKAVGVRSSQGIGGGAAGLIINLATALITQIASSPQQTYEVSRLATTLMAIGLLRGPRDPEYANDKRGR